MSITEKEKMLSGKMYHAFDPVLSAERLAAREIVYDLNQFRPRDIDSRNALIKKLFGKTEEIFHIEPPFNCDYGYNILIGNHFYANFNLVILDCAPVTFGNHVFIGPNVGIYTAGHPLDAEKRNAEFEFALPVTIGDNVWIGGNVVINPGINIGNNTVIGSGSIVTKDIPANSLAVGNPCRVIRSIPANNASPEILP